VKWTNICKVIYILIESCTFLIGINFFLFWQYRRKLKDFALGFSTYTTQGTVIDCRFTNAATGGWEKRITYSLLLLARFGEERFPRYLGLAITPQTHCTSGAPVHRSRFRFNSSGTADISTLWKKAGTRRAWRYATAVRLVHECNRLTI